MGQQCTKNSTKSGKPATRQSTYKKSKSIANTQQPTSNSKYFQSLSNFESIKDNFETIDEVQTQLNKEGLESCQLIVGIDFTRSNEWSGKNTFGKNLHNISGEEKNPYEIVIATIAETLSKFDDDNLIPAYGFGDTSSKDTGVFSLQFDNQPCDGLEGLVRKYKETLGHVYLSGPTSFGPLIEQACKTVIESGYQYHILLIIADGQITRGTHIPQGQYSRQELDTISMIVEASKLPLSIVMVGVGDGPWDTMEKFDDGLPQRSFDNFQFVNFTSIYEQYKLHQNFKELQKDFALKALMEIPDQYKIITQRNLDRNRPQILYKHNKDALNPPYNPQKALRTAAFNSGDPFAGEGTNQPGSQFNSFKSFNQTNVQTSGNSNSFGQHRLQTMYQDQQYPPLNNDRLNTYGNDQFAQQQVPSSHYPQLTPVVPDIQPPRNYQTSSSFQYGHEYRREGDENFSNYNHQGNLNGDVPMYRSMDLSVDKRKERYKNKNVEQNLICPITQEIMEDPVIAADGNTYERRAIQTWIRDHDTSPMTSATLKNKNLIPNNVIKSLVQNLDKSN